MTDKENTQEVEKTLEEKVMEQIMAKSGVSKEWADNHLVISVWKGDE